MSNIRKIFNARSIAIIGASASPEKTGHIILKNIIEGEFAGDIFPVNPGEEEILGYSCYRSIKKIPATNIDLAVIIVPARFVEGILLEAASKNVAGAVIISGGFGEIGNNDLEKSVLSTARKAGIRLLGPNCQGFSYSPNNLCATWPLMKGEGSMAIISQSGTVGAAFAGWAEDDHLGLTSFISLGNKSDLDELDFLDYFTEDQSTSVIGLYIEGVKDGRLFMKRAGAAVAKKPVVVLRPGQTEKGKAAIQSHTKSIAGDHRIFAAAAKQAGIIRAETVEELYDFSKILSLCNLPGGNRCLVITSSGGSGILATDVAERSGINIVRLDEQTRGELEQSLPAHCVINNPLDLTGDTDAGRYYQAVQKIKEVDYIDLILIIFGDPIPGAAGVVKKLQQEVPQEIVGCYLGGGSIQKLEMQKMQEYGVPVYPTPERAMRAIAALNEYRKYRKRNYNLSMEV